MHKCNVKISTLDTPRKVIKHTRTCAHKLKCKQDQFTVSPPQGSDNSSKQVNLQSTFMPVEGCQRKLDNSQKLTN
jgi:hypothetical protein